MKLKPTLFQLRRDMARMNGEPLPKRKAMSKAARKELIELRIQSYRREQETVSKLLEGYLGPWTNQPEAIEWRDPATGYKCVIRKHPIFATLMGYVRIMRDHPLYGKDLRDKSRLYVHGGVTFSRIMKHDRWMKRGQWVGFDCAHAGDLNPGTTALMAKYPSGPFSMNERYRDVEYVKEQVQLLALQLKKKERV